jgi:hypothetical protein
MKIKKINKASTSPVKRPTARLPLAITEKKRKKVGPSDLVNVPETSMVLSIDLKRQSDADIYALEINEDQRFFPYTVLPRLLVGWQSIGLISSLELKVSSENPLPQMVVRFVEKLTPDDVAKLDPGLKAQIEANIALIRQYPFVKVESPILA